MGKLTQKRKAFIKFFPECGFNATAAARKAGYKFPRRAATALLRNDSVKEELDKLYRELTMSAEEVLGRLTEQARADYGAYINKDGTVNIAQIIEDGKSHLIKKISDTKYGKVVEFYDAQTALNLMGKYWRVFVDRNENINIDLDSCTDEQLERIANGENPVDVLLS